MLVANTEIRQAEIDPAGVLIHWQDGTENLFHSIWLRDNCRCDRCGDPATGRRSLRLSALDLDCKPLTLKNLVQQLEISWSDVHQSSYSVDWLKANAYDFSSRENRVFKPALWDDNFRKKPLSFEFSETEYSDKSLLKVLQAVRDHGLCFIRNAPSKAGVVETLARRVGFPQESNFGRIQDLIVDSNKRSVANDVVPLKLHTDEPYRATPPGILMFHCVTTDIDGAGSSIFMDGFDIAERLRREDPDGFEALCSYNHRFRRHFENDVDLITEFPVLSVDAFGHLNGIRLNDRVAAPLSIPPSQLKVYYRGLKRLLELSEDDELTMKLRLRPGDIAIFDNHRILHGRTRLTLKSKRWLQWVQIERGDFHSSLRIIADHLGESRDANLFLRGAYG